MQRVEAVGLDVVRQLRAAADAGEQHHVMWCKLELDQGLLDGGEDAEVAAARAPGVLVYALIRLQSYMGQSPRS